MTTLCDKQQDGTQSHVLPCMQNGKKASRHDLAKAVHHHKALNSQSEKCLTKPESVIASTDCRRHAHVPTPKSISDRSVLKRLLLARKIAEYEALCARLDAVRAEMDADAARETKT